MSSMLLKTGGLDNMHSQTSDGVGWGGGGGGTVDGGRSMPKNNLFLVENVHVIQHLGLDGLTATN